MVLDHDSIKRHWEDWAKKYGVDLHATTKTSTAKELEIDALASAFERVLTTKPESSDVLEVGCGNGFNCIALSKAFSKLNFTGLDYVAGMVENARKIKESAQADNTRFVQGDVLALSSNHELKPAYDIVFTDRCLINLNSLSKQLGAFDQLLEKTRTGGHLILIENSDESYGYQNKLREAGGLSPRTPPEFNLFLNESAFLQHAGQKSKLVAKEDFIGLHDLVLYVLVPMINGGQVDYGHPLVQAAADVSIAGRKKNVPSFGPFGQNRLYIFQNSR